VTNGSIYLVRRVAKRSLTSVLMIVMVMAMLPVAPAQAAAAYDPFFAQPSTIANVSTLAPTGTTANRNFGVAVGDYNEDGNQDVVTGRVDGRIAYIPGTAGGSFGAATLFAWKQTTFNAAAFAPADVNNDGNLDVVWGANAATTGCSVSPIPVGGTCATAGGVTVTVNDGDVRAFLGNGNGTFQENVYFVTGVRHNAGALVADVFTADAGSVAAGDVDGDGDSDLVAGGIDGANTMVKLLTNGAGTLPFAGSNVASQATTCSPSTACSPIYFPPTSLQNSPWGLAFGDVDNDGDKDLFVGDRALYVYLYKNNGTGTLTLQTGNSSPPASRSNAYLDHDQVRFSVNATPYLAAGDMNGDDKADLMLGLHSGTSTSAAPIANDGIVYLDVSSGTTHKAFGSIGQLGVAQARGINVVDVNGDGARDVVGGDYDGRVRLLRQLPPIDSDSDGVSNYVDNAPNDANAARIDMNTDGSITHLDQLDNDFDTVLGDPENQVTWQRLGDVADPDDDNDGSLDGEDNCAYTSNGGQTDEDGDGAGDACDPLDDDDTDGDGVPDGPAPGDPLYDETLAAKQKWSTGDTHFVIRIDALGRLFQNEFTSLMTDAATLSPAEWADKCWENYEPGDAPSTSTPDPAYEPCGTGEGTVDEALTLDGGKNLPTTVVVIPRLLWTDTDVTDWINNRNNSSNLEIGQHGSYHFSHTELGDWGTATDGRQVFSCETCGLTEAENYELLKVGYDTLAGNYSNKWIAESGATAGSPKIDWSTSANPLISYAPPFNASDTMSRKATAMLGYKAFSASINEEEGYVGYPENFFSPEGSHHEDFDQFGIFHASADHEVEPPETAAGTYDPVEYAGYLDSVTEDGGLNTWLIEEVEWSGRPCNDDERVTGPNRAPAPVTCAEGLATTAPNNRENNTVYEARWDGWMQLLDHVKNYDGGVVMTMGEVALAKGFDNAPTVPNPGQADADNDGVGDVIDGASMDAGTVNLTRNASSNLSATLINGNGDPVSGQEVEFTFDADGDSTDETYTGTTNGSGVATAAVTATRPVGQYPFGASWDGGNGVSASDTGTADVGDVTTLTLDATNPTSGQVTDPVTVGAALVDTDGAPIEGKTVSFAVGSATGVGTTDAAGHASAVLTLQGPAGASTLTASFAGAPSYAADGDSAAFTVNKENTTLTLSDAVAVKNSPAIATATLKEADGAPLAGQTITFLVQQKVRNTITYNVMGTAQTNASGVATFTVPTKYVGTARAKTPIRATSAEDASFLGATGNASAYK
jgi:FG-GAP-like repeat